MPGTTAAAALISLSRWGLLTHSTSHCTAVMKRCTVVCAESKLTAGFSAYMHTYMLQPEARPQPLD